MTPDVSTTYAFLRYVHEPAIDAGLDGRLVVSEKQPSGSPVRYLSADYGLDELDEAAAAFGRISGRGRNGYCRVHLMDQRLPNSWKRGGGECTRWVTHFAADVDIAGPGHKPSAKGLPHPPDVDAALGLIDATLAPSAIVHSGGGLYPVWRLAEPYEVVDDDGRARVKAVGAGLDRALGSHDYHVDATCTDLARIIRPPGAMNNKPGRDPRPVTVLRGYTDGAGDYTLDDLEAVAEQARNIAHLQDSRKVDTAPPRPRQTAHAADTAPWELFKARYTIDDVLAADTGHAWHEVRGSSNAWRYWLRDGASSDYSIKQNRDTGVVIVWSSVIAADLGIEPGHDGLDLWGFACRLAGIDPTVAAKGGAS